MQTNHTRRRASCWLVALFALVPRFADAEPAASPELLRPYLVALSVPELDAAIRWYEENLAFKVARRLAFPEATLAIAMLERDGFKLELVEIAGSAPLSKLVPGGDNPAMIQGFGKLAFWVRDPDVWAARFKAREVHFQMQPRDDPEDGTRSFIVLDCGGNWVQITGPKPNG